MINWIMDDILADFLRNALQSRPFHCVKSVESFSGPYFPAFGQDTERYSVFREKLRIQTLFTQCLLKQMICSYLSEI